MKHTKRTLTLFLFLLLMGALLTACSSGQSSTDSQTSGEMSEAGQDSSDSGSDADSDSADTGSSGGETNEPLYLGTFTMQDIDGNTYTEAMFQDYDLTMVNVFATWCSPCIREIPDLQELSQNMAEKNVHIVGIVLDGRNFEGEVDQEALETAQLLAEETGASYPFLVPDEGLMNGLLTGVQAVPTTFFVDNGGNLVGNVYARSYSLEDWTEIVNAELEALEAAE